jgi:hypothetical protein
MSIPLLFKIDVEIWINCALLYVLIQRYSREHIFLSALNAPPHYFVFSLESSESSLEQGTRDSTQYD